MKFLTLVILRCFSIIPLPILHWIGDRIGIIFYYCSSTTRNRTIQNLKYSAIITDSSQIKNYAKQVSKETIKTSLELSIALQRNSEYIKSLFIETTGESYLEAAILKQHGILFITPHIGSYDLAGRELSEMLPFPLTALYKPPKLEWLRDIIKKGRQRDNAKVAEANAKGVREIVKALKNKQAVIILPDQVPETGEGIMAKFFNQPAYSMTLAARMATMNNITTLFFVAERLPHGKGFKLHIYPLKQQLTQDKRINTQIINNQLEDLIRQFPSQYLFSYNRYKIPAGCENK